MRKFPIKSAIAILFATGTANVSASHTLLHCGRTVDVRALEVLAERTIVVDGQKIVRADRGYTSTPDAEVVNLKGHTCLPGLIDLRVHLTFS